MVRRPKTVVLQLLGVAMLIPGLLRVPLPQADFHVIRHHHGVGEICPQHDHLLRWHPQADQNQDVAVLHWHWFLPQTVDASLAGAFGFSPALHAHIADSLQPEWNGDLAIIAENPGTISGQIHLGSRLDFALADAVWIIPPIYPTLSSWARYHVEQDEHAAGTVLARLVRWNC